MSNNELERLIAQEGNHEAWEYISDPRYKCEMLRNDMGVWCGYVSVPKGHPCFGLHYDAISDSYPNDLSVHGGLTYAEPDGEPTPFIFGEDRKETQRRLTEGSEKVDYWKIGFDCAHAYDLYLPAPYDHSPRYYEVNKDNGLIQDQYGATYKNKTWVWNEVNSLARQLKEIEENSNKK